MRRISLAVGLCLASFLLASVAAAEETGSVTLKTTTVVGTYRRPTAVIEVARAKPELKLKDLQDPKVEKIMRAAANAPF
ncbi:MAG TPA: hypothetical protein VLT33_23680 [Labilithrix sp.]|nr:hypothetical protein [Labilithrix sp.]